LFIVLVAVSDHACSSMMLPLYWYASPATITGFSVPFGIGIDRVSCHCPAYGPFTWYTRTPRVPVPCAALNTTDPAKS
jgi:hypothetical protein